MPRIVIRVLVSLAIAFSVPAFAAPAPMAPFTKGVNLSGWFETDSPRAIQFSRYSRRDFSELKALGCDVVRLPINLKSMTSGAPDYRVDPLLFAFLDEVVAWAEDVGIHIIIDNHTFNTAIPTERDVERVLLAEWKQLAARYRGRSSLVVYEILNEPHGIDCARWAKIQGNVVAAIRKIDASHAIIVGSANFNNYRDLLGLPTYPHDNIIYTFHFYDPMVFTHQGASWTIPSMEALSGVPFPGDAARMPVVPAALKGTWVANDLREYANAATPRRIAELLDGPARFARERNVPVFCGEFGAYMTSDPSPDRVVWHRVVREALEARGISWALWDAYGSFGLFKTALGGNVDSDLDVPLVAALGLVAPPQGPGVKAPATGPITIFADSPGEDFVAGAYGNKGVADFYSAEGPASGKYALRWGSCDRYGAVRFSFRRPADLSSLAKEGYALSLSARATGNGAAIELRFVDTETPSGDKPWRTCATLDGGRLPADGEWHRVRIPLSEMRETGAWDGAWTEATGLFSWSRVAAFEIVAEHEPLAETAFSFDDIMIEK